MRDNVKLFPAHKRKRYHTCMYLNVSVRNIESQDKKRQMQYFILPTCEIHSKINTQFITGYTYVITKQLKFNTRV